MQRIIPILFVILFLGGGIYYLFSNQLGFKQNQNPPIALPQGGVCDAETMTCSDGTVLHKQGSDCSFPPCPSSSASSSDILQGNQFTISGIMICLPHKNTSGPQTLECAFGLKGDDGNNYGLTDPGWKYLIGVGNGTKVEITGKLTKKNDSKYDSVGTIEIESLTKK